MVAYGSSLKTGRRQGWEWEAAYLDYDRLKEILEEMEATATANNTLTVCDDAQNAQAQAHPRIIISYRVMSIFWWN
jgi:hypothetical protein